MNAFDIPGWMRKRELGWLAEQASKNDLIIEIGTWMGKSTYAMAEKTNGKIIAIDSFKMKGVPPRWDTAIEASKELVNDPDWLYNRCIDNLYGFIEDGRVEVIRGDSNEVIKNLGGLTGEVDMVFIDGSHDYESVRSDIINYKPLLKKNGLLCGHDCGHEVAKAVGELLPGYKVKRNTTIWYWREDQEKNYGTR